MPTPTEIAAKKVAYEAEVRRKKFLAYTGYSVVGVVFVVLIMVLSGMHILGLQGIYNAESGVYADCSKPENKGISYCQPKMSSSERSWRDLVTGGRRAAPFTLHND